MRTATNERNGRGTSFCFRSSMHPSSFKPRILAIFFLADSFCAEVEDFSGVAALTVPGVPDIIFR